MRVLITTKIELSAEEVFSEFNEKLFNKLLPPSFLASATKYEGEHIGNRVRVDFKVPLVGSMEVEITERQESSSPYYFTDKGRQLPFPLRSWKHRHEVRRITDHSCVIIDDIAYSSGYSLLDFLLYPPLYFSFYLRKPTYRKYFRRS